LVFSPDQRARIGLDSRTAATREIRRRCVELFWMALHVPREEGHERPDGGASRLSPARRIICGTAARLCPAMVLNSSTTLAPLITPSTLLSSFLLADS
jgi:hypothetical protein